MSKVQYIERVHVNHSRLHVYIDRFLFSFEHQRLIYLAGEPRVGNQLFSAQTYEHTCTCMCSSFSEVVDLLPDFRSDVRDTVTYFMCRMGVLGRSQSRIDEEPVVRSNAEVRQVVFSEYLADERVDWGLGTKREQDGNSDVVQCGDFLFVLTEDRSR